MKLTMEILQQLPNGEVFRVVTTKLQTMHQPMKAELTFVCVKGDGGNDWCIYGHFAYKGVEYIRDNGDKVTSTELIQSLCPCDAEALSRYRL